MELLYTMYCDAVGLPLPTARTQTFTGVPFFPAVGMFVTWLFTIILVLGIKGFVVTYIMGGTTSIYFSLRRDVDGTEDSEIYVEGDDEFDEFDRQPVPDVFFAGMALYDGDTNTPRRSGSTALMACAAARSASCQSAS
mgnify:CR=1 FL=1